MKNLSIRVFQLFLCLLLSSGLGLAAHAAPPDYSGMTALSDEQLGDVTGQALLMMDSRPGQGISSGLNFYKVGLDAAVDLNLNIAKLQLGCGGVNGPGCDIDIDNLGLSGNCTSGRPGCSAVLTRPFFEFAINESVDTGLREIVGFRLSAEQADGMMTFGIENSATPNGINTLSGYLELESVSGTGMTERRNMTYADTNMALTGRVIVSYAFGLKGTYDFTSTDYTVQVNPAQAHFTTAPTVVSGNRLTAVELNATATVGNIGIACPSGMNNACLTAVAAGTPLGNITLTEGVVGQVKGVKAAVQFSESLGYIHKIGVSNPFSLSMQSQTLQWPGAAAAAERGWWLAFEDPINIGDVSPSDPIKITDDVLKQLVQPISDVLAANPPECGLLSCLTGTTLNVGTIDLTNYFSNPANYLDMPLSDLRLSAQNFAPNCWGNAKFC
ncbi:hypothetical protein [Isoalcanivorax beigongshangi]|uniref:Uncharacterized protein n=1 Tax=Isoalcanivorax beigongshangi TaxID=3238810 RepID=A0ABV4AJF9_9GAMM